jgi:hypothetical protein
VSHILAVGGPAHGRRLTTMPGGIADAATLDWSFRDHENGGDWATAIYVRRRVDLSERCFDVWLLANFQRSGEQEVLGLVLDAVMTERDALVDAGADMLEALRGIVRPKSDLGVLVRAAGGGE